MAPTNLASIRTAKDRDARLDQKLRRELGEGVLKLLADERTEDRCLNPDSSCAAGGHSRLGPPVPTPENSRGEFMTTRSTTANTAGATPVADSSRSATDTTLRCLVDAIAEEVAARVKTEISVHLRHVKTMNSVGDP